MRLKHISTNIEDYLGQAGVPPKYIPCSFDNFKTGRSFEKAFNLCKDYAGDPSSSLFIYGSYGTGKTHMAVAIARELLLQGRKVVFTSVPRLLFEIRKAFQEDTRETEAVYVEKYSSCEFLVLDDFGLEKATEWARQTMDYIIYQRDNLLKPVVITSNLSLDEIARKIDGRIASRIAGMGKIVQFNGPDFRLKRKGVKE
jgi:DNA replication protein DnaC